MVLIAEDEQTKRKNIGVINVYIFLHLGLEGVEFYAARRYVYLTKDGREEDLFSVMKSKKTIK